MTRPLDVRAIGDHRWLFEVDLADEPPVVDLGDVTIVSPPGITVELVVAPPPDAPARWGVVARGALPSATVELAVAGTAHVGAVPGRAPEPRPPVATQTDFRARDYSAVRQMMLERIETTADVRGSGDPVAETAGLVEVLAFLADTLSYAQDAVATEAYLATCRRRISATRHAALLGYNVHQGSNARTWVRIDIAGDEEADLPKGTMLWTGGTDIPARGTSRDPGAIPGAIVFETMTDVRLYPQQPPLELDPTAHPDRFLAAGATAATVLGHHRRLRRGTLLTIEPAEGPAESHVVRVLSAESSGGRDRVTRLRWGPEDALPGAAAFRRPVMLHRYNLVLADHGRTVPPVGMPPDRLPPSRRGRRYWPQLPHLDVTFARGLPEGPRVSAARMVEGAGDAVAVVDVEEESGARTRRWRARRSLLRSGPATRDLVVELDDAGAARVRFGDGVNGMGPPDGAVLRVRQRVGGGLAGNVAAGEITRIATNVPVEVACVRNVVAARGGTAPETLASVKTHAPRAFRRNERVVTPDDYEDAARSVKGVLDVDAVVGSTGAGPSVTVYVHAGWPQRHEVRRSVVALLRRRHVLGVTPNVVLAVAVPVDIALDVVLLPGWTEAFTGARVEEALSALLASGRFGFRASLFQSEVVVPVAGIEGVADVRVTRFGPAGIPGPPRDSIRPGLGQVLRVDRVERAGEDRSQSGGRIVYRLRSAGR